MTHLDLFSGIGGFSLASEMVWPYIKHVFCEIDPFCQAVLKKHWPYSPIYGDIKTLTNARSKKPRGIPSIKGKEIPALGACDLLTGGFPCQPFSHAGRRKGTDDERHLWPEMRRIIQEFSPRYVMAENVRGLLSINGGVVFEQVCLDLEAIGYEVQPFIIPACAINAPHRRDRVWIVAYSKHKPKRNTECGRTDQGAPSRITGSDSQWREDWSAVASRLCRLDDGLSERMARPRGWRNAALKAYGNAIVPQVAIEVFKTIKTLEETI